MSTMNGRILKLERDELGFATGSGRNIARKCDEWLKKRGLGSSHRDFVYSFKQRGRKVHS